LANDVVLFGDEIGPASELEVRECFAEVGHERLDVGAAAARLVERILQQHIREIPTNTGNTRGSKSRRT
jgi:hypothetical protein